jgi:hypothetical protein
MVPPDSYGGQDRTRRRYERLMERLSYVDVGRRFRRDEFNER